MNAEAARNRGYAYRARIDDRSDGRALVEWLPAHYTHTDAAGWRERVRAGQVSVDGRTVDESCVLRSGQTVVWFRPPWIEPGVPTDVRTVHRDADLLAVAKPSGLPTVPAGGFLEHTLLAFVRRDVPGATPLHRLGRHTSGLVLFALNRAALAAVSRQWREGAVEKRYRALATGTPARDAFAIDQPIGPVPHPRLGTVHAASPGGKPAHSEVTVVGRRDDAFLADVTIATGRPHQIRIHLAAAGHPLVGDPLYGPGGLPRGDALPGDPGYHLHAAELSLTHPTTKTTLHLTHPPPVPLTA